MNKVGVIFDFNGTLYWDSEYQETAWEKYMEKHDIKLSKSQKRDMHGRNGKDTFEYLFKRSVDDSEVSFYTEEREVIYRAECLKHKMELAPGAISLINYLKSEGIPIAIATAAGKSNVDFFIDKFNLLHYFSMEHIIYNDGTVKGKPNPDLFEKAMKILGVNKENSIIFEDSYSGIQAAINSKAAKVMIVDSAGENYDQFNLPVIKHFDEFDRKLIKLLKPA